MRIARPPAWFAGFAAGKVAKAGVFEQAPDGLGKANAVLWCDGYNGALKERGLELQPPKRRKRRRRKDPKPQGWRSESMMQNTITRDGTRAVVIVMLEKPYPVLMIEADADAGFNVFDSHSHLIVAKGCESLAAAFTLGDLALEQWRPGQRPECACTEIGEESENVAAE